MRVAMHDAAAMLMDRMLSQRADVGSWGLQDYVPFSQYFPKSIFP